MHIVKHKILPKFCAGGCACTLPIQLIWAPNLSNICWVTVPQIPNYKLIIDQHFPSPINWIVFCLFVGVWPGVMMWNNSVCWCFDVLHLNHFVEFIPEIGSVNCSLCLQHTTHNTGSDAFNQGVKFVIETFDKQGMVGGQGVEYIRTIMYGYEYLV